MLIPLTPCYLFINIDERFLWTRWVTKASERLCRATAGIFHAPRKDEHLESPRGHCLELPHLFSPPSPLLHPDNLRWCSLSWRRRRRGGGCWRRGRLEEEERRKGRRDKEGAGRLSTQRGRGEGWKGSGGQGGGLWRSRGDGELPLSHESSFSDGNGRVSSSPWTMALFGRLPVATKNWGGRRWRSPSLLSPSLGQSEGPSPGGALCRFAGCRQAYHPGPRGTKTGWKNANKMGGGTWEGEKRGRERKAERFQHK